MSLKKINVGEACDLEALSRGMGYDCRLFMNMQERGVIPKDASTKCVGAYCVGCPGLPGGSEPTHPTSYKTF